MGMITVVIQHMTIIDEIIMHLLLHRLQCLVLVISSTLDVMDCPTLTLFLNEKLFHFRFGLWGCRDRKTSHDHFVDSFLYIGLQNCHCP